MAVKLTKKRMKQFKEAFALFDTDGDGKITPTELKTAMESLGHNPTDAELQNVINGVDADGNGTIEFPEFLAMMKKKMRDEENDEIMKNALKSLADEDTGYVSAADLRDIMDSIGADEDVDAIIREADTNSDGQVNYKELMKKIQSISAKKSAV